MRALIQPIRKCWEGGIRLSIVAFAPPSPRPVFNLQPRHASEFAGVIGDEGQVAGLGQTGDQHVVGTDGGSGGGERGEDFAQRPKESIGRTRLNLGSAARRHCEAP